MNKKIAGIFIFVCGVIVLGIEIIFTVMALVNGQGVGDGGEAILTTLLTGIFLIWFGLKLKKEGK